MDSFKIAVFGCWNEGCKENSGQKSVANLIKANQSKYKFMVILGDNYYAKKKTLIETNETKLKIKLTDIKDLKKGFECLEGIDLEKKIIMGNHDIEDSIDKSCSILKAQLKIPWYDVKFPFGYDLYYLYGDKLNTYTKTILFIYLDTTMYSDDVTDIGSCYSSVLNQDIKSLIEQQNNFITETLKLIENQQIYNIKDVVFIGHEPLLTFKEKKGIKEIYIIKKLLKIIFSEKEKYINTNFHWICADYHIYQNSIITSDSNIELQISQWIFGTGGGKLDNLPSTKILNVMDYKLNILPNIVYDHNGNNVSQQFNDNETNQYYGCDKFGYGEISFDLCEITHKFILSNYDYSINKPKKAKVSKDKKLNESIDTNIIGGMILEEQNYKSKYLKYKNKYLELKNILSTQN